ncbi:MAG: hypothetical protein AAF481_18355 [Acidobacteriota bacterium]
MIRPTRLRHRRGEAGYNMALLVIAITVINIMLAAAMPMWSYRIKKDKEEELRSRGLQYAEAIRIFRGRYGRQPTTLKELIEIKPRSIRQLWDDPMTENGEWGLIFAQRVGGGGNRNPQQPPQQGTVAVDPTTSPDGRKRTVTVGPILGVYSLSDEDALSSFFGKATYKEWQFTADLLQRNTIGGAGVGGGGDPGKIPRLEVRTLGRPFIPELQNELLQPQMGGGTQLVPNLPGQPGQPGQGGGTFGGQPGNRPGFNPGVPGGTTGAQPGFNPDDPGTSRPQNPRVNPPRNPRPRNPRPGFPVLPGQPGDPTSGQPGDDRPGTNPGGNPGGGGIDPTVPQNLSRSVFRPTPSNP